MTSHDVGPLAPIHLHPAIIVMGGFAVAVIGRRTWPLDVRGMTGVLLTALGASLIIVGIALLFLAYGAMARAKTTIDPRQHTTALVTSGVYRISRNPIYLGWLLFTAGLGVVNLSLLPLVVALVMLCLLNWAVVINEETYLERVFGEVYLRYKDTVRRWI